MESDAQSHVTKQPLLRAAAVAVSQGRDHLVLLRWHVQTLVAVHMHQGESLEKEGRRDRQLHRCKHVERMYKYTNQHFITYRLF